MDREQMELLERLARLRELRALSEDEFEREKEDLLYPNSPGPSLVVLPGAKQDVPRVVAAMRSPGPPRGRGRVIQRPRGMLAGWVLWILFSVGGLYALDEGNSLLALALLSSGLLFAPPFQRLLASRIGTPMRVGVTLVAAYLLMGVAAAPAPPATPADASLAGACGGMLKETIVARSRLAGEAVARPWRTMWEDLTWARSAGRSAYQAWLQGEPFVTASG